MPEVKKIQNIESYDASKVSDVVLMDDWRISAGWYSSIKEGKEFKYTQEEVEKLAVKILAEILKRGKITFHPENTKEQSLVLLGKSLTNLVKGGLYLTEPHGELLYQDKKTAIVKSREFKRLQDFNILISGTKAYGFIRFKAPEEIGLEDFKKRYNEHKISEEERESWWPTKTELYLSSIRDFVKYDKPRIVKPTTGAQVFINQVEFAKRDENIIVIPDFISQVGSSVGEENPEDRDILFRIDACEHNESLRESLILLMRKHLDPDKKDLPLHYIFNASGPHDDYLPLFNLELIPLKAKVVTIKAERIKLDLGCGENKPKGYIGLDIKELEGVDKVCDLEQGIPYPDNSVDIVRAHHFLEHINNPVKIMDEIWRVLKSGGVLEFEVPSTEGEGAFADPSHKSAWNKLSFQFYTDDKLRDEAGTKAKFDIVELEEVKDPKWNTVYVRGKLKAVKSEIRKKALKPFGDYIPPKPAMAGLTEAWDVEEIWDWAKERIVA